jgi:lipopolysaccharide transport system permease protein
MEYEIKPKNKLTIGIGELWQFRELFYYFTWRDIKVKYKQTVLGFAWAILQPLVMTALLSISLGKIISIYSQLTIPYPIFVMNGLIMWNIFSSGLSNAGNSMVTNSNIIKKIYFPRLIIPISAVLVSIFDFIMALIIFILLLIYYQLPINILHFITMLFISIFITTIATFGMGTLLAALNIKYRDFRYVVPFVIQALLFITPVIYPVTIVSNIWTKYFLALNPMYSAIEIFRHSIIQKSLEMNLILVSTSSAIVFFIVGLLYFRKTEAYFADLA